MKLILHIGTPKTGSTSIQRFLLQNQITLINNGYFYFTLENKKKIFNENLTNQNVHLLVAYFNKAHSYFKFHNCDTELKKEKLKEKIFINFEENILKIPKNTKTVIMSSEGFWQHFKHKEKLNLLKLLLFKSFKTIEIICYIRPQCDQAMSFFSVNLMNGKRNMNYREYLDKKLQPNAHYYNYYQNLLSWEEFFGIENIKLRLFQQNYFTNNDLLDDFSNLIDTNLLGKLSKIKEQNVSLNHFGHILMNSFNKYFHEFGGLNSFKEKKFIDFKNIITKHAKDKLYRIPFDEYLEFQKRFDESNEALRKKYFPNRKVLFENVKDYNTNRLMSKNHEELLDQVIKLFSQWIKD